MEPHSIKAIEKLKTLNKSKVNYHPKFWNLNFSKNKEDKSIINEKIDKFLKISTSQEFDIKLKKINSSLPLTNTENSVKKKLKLVKIKKTIENDIYIPNEVFQEERNKSRRSLISQKKKFKFDTNEFISIKIKKRSNSINCVVPRSFIKFNLPKLQRNETSILFSYYKNEKSIPKRKSILDPPIRIKCKAKSLDLYKKDYYFKKFYVKHYIERQNKIKRQLEDIKEKEKHERKELLKKNNKKDKYFEPSSSSFANNMLNLCKILSPLKERCKSHVRERAEFSIKQENANTINVTNYSSSVNAFFLSNKSSQIFNNTQLNQGNNFSQSLSSMKTIMSAPNTNRLKSTGKSKFSSSNTSKLFAISKLSKDIVSKCRETGETSSNILGELNSVLNEYNLRDEEFLKSLIIETETQQQINREIRKEFRKFKDTKRIFVHPYGLNGKMELVTSDKNNPLILGKKIEGLGSEMAYNSRKIIFNLFDTRIEPGEIINYEPDVNKFLKTSDYLKIIKENRMEINSINLKKSYYNLKLKNLKVNDKVRDLLKNLNKGK